MTMARTDSSFHFWRDTIGIVTSVWFASFILGTRHCASDNQSIRNLLGVAIRCGQDQPDEYGKLASRCNTATSQTRRLIERVGRTTSAHLFLSVANHRLGHAEKCP